MPNLTILVLQPLFTFSDSARAALSENWLIIVQSDSCALMHAAQFESHLLAPRLARTELITAVTDEDVIHGDSSVNQVQNLMHVFDRSEDLSKPVLSRALAHLEHSFFTVRRESLPQRLRAREALCTAELLDCHNIALLAQHIVQLDDVWMRDLSLKDVLEHVYFLHVAYQEAAGLLTSFVLLFVLLLLGCSLAP